MASPTFRSWAKPDGPAGKAARRLAFGAPWVLAARPGKSNIGRLRRARRCVQASSRTDLPGIAVVPACRPPVVIRRASVAVDVIATGCGGSGSSQHSVHPHAPLVAWSRAARERVRDACHALLTGDRGVAASAAEHQGNLRHDAHDVVGMEIANVLVLELQGQVAIVEATDSNRRSWGDIEDSMAVKLEPEGSASEPHGVRPLSVGAHHGDSQPVVVSPLGKADVGLGRAPLATWPPWGGILAGPPRWPRRSTPHRFARHRPSAAAHRGKQDKFLPGRIWTNCD